MKSHDLLDVFKNAIKEEKQVSKRIVYRDTPLKKTQRAEFKSRIRGRTSESGRVDIMKYYTDYVAMNPAASDALKPEAVLSRREDLRESMGTRGRNSGKERFVNYRGGLMSTRNIKNDTLAVNPLNVPANTAAPEGIFGFAVSEKSGIIGKNRRIPQLIHKTIHDVPLPSQVRRESMITKADIGNKKGMQIANTMKFDLFGH